MTRAIGLIVGGLSLALGVSAEAQPTPTTIQPDTGGYPAAALPPSAAPAPSDRVPPASTPEGGPNAPEQLIAPAAH